MKNKLFALFMVFLICFSVSACSLFETGSDSGNSSEGVEIADENADQFVDEDGNVIEDIDPETGVTLLPEGNGISFDEEGEGVTIKPKKSLASEFVGKWEATSDQAIFLYGNLDLTVAANKSWTADITGEKYVGKWKEFDDGLRLTSDNLVFDLVFDQGGKLILIEHVDDSGQEYHTVLTKKD